MRAADGLWEHAQARWNALREMIGFGDALATLPPWLAPPLAVGSLLALAVLAGIGVAALGLLLTVLLAAHLLLDQVFGLRIDVALPR
ncbi:MAG: hypothetical protein U0802_25200 [Candidatus Binatia bacterium]